MNGILRQIVTDQKNGTAVGIYSVCSAHPFVLEAAMRKAIQDESVVLIESTSNQVDQFGGYTGMKPQQFAQFVGDVARQTGLPLERVLLGGDHLGPNTWQSLPAAQAMAHARDLVRSYVEAGYEKIHLDASMRCADDKGDGDDPLPDEIVGTRAADLCQQCEQAYANSPGSASAPVYVIGTEVPVPGGMAAGSGVVQPTDPKSALRTVEVTREAFLRRGLDDAWQRVIATVVQPGVEFGDDVVVEYDSERASELVQESITLDGLVFEAHSTDYQTQNVLQNLVRDHFAFLKVGPWLTYRVREAVLGLEQIERISLAGRRGVTLSDVMNTLETAMQNDPRRWQRYYTGDDIYLRYARTYSYSDRIRYYWMQPEVQTAVNRLLDNLRANPIPMPLMSQYLPKQYDAIRNREISGDPVDIIHHGIWEILDLYSKACGMSKKPRS